MRTLLTVVALALLALPAPADAKRRTVRLKAFSSCTSLANYGARNLDRYGHPGGPPMSARPMPATDMEGGAGAGGEAPSSAPAPQSGGPERASDFSTTNVQEAGIDEPDIVKTDGNVIYALQGTTLRAVDARATTPVKLGRIALGENTFDHRMLIHGDRLLVVYGAYPPAPAQQPPAQDAPASSSPAPYAQPQTVAAEVDISNPRAMRIVRTLTVDGSFVSARLVGRTARLVLSSTPHAVLASGPAEGGAARTAAKRRRVRGWLPSGVMRYSSGRKGSRRSVVRCRSVRRPASFSGLDMLTVLTVDMKKGLPAVDADALMTSADTVYASEGSLYVATQRFVPSLQRERPTVPEGMSTALHRFDISDPDQTVYRASGEVPGFLLSQWALSERKGKLRVASTDTPTWWGVDEQRPSESFVTVLDERDGRLVKTGQVGGLGKGERIYAVRFIEDLGYVVTFRETDPLYTVDVSDPAAPKVLGELKILGYSAYLHPAGDGLLIGVGQDASEEGRRLGTQISLFDVSDPATPTRLHARRLGSHSTSDIEWDHHAFLFWDPTDLAMIPLQEYDDRQSFQGAVGLRITRAGISEVRRVSHPSDQPWMARVQRSLVIGDRVFTLSSAGLKASRLDDLADVAWVPFQA